MRYRAKSGRTARPCAFLIGLGALASLLAFAPPSVAAPPVHEFLEDLTLDGFSRPAEETSPTAGFNKACGTAVDSEGDLYVASAGKSAIDIFRPSGSPGEPWDFLSSIENANGPCGLAVDSEGILYVSETTGERRVVKYDPIEYPFLGPPSYEPPVPIDESGVAEGIAVDPFDDRLYVAKGDRVEVYNADGSFGSVDEIQMLTVQATDGTFTLSFEDEPTGPFPYNATHAEIQAALEALPGIGAGNVAVTEGSPGWEGRQHVIAFQGALADMDLPQIMGDGSGLTGGSPSFASTGTIVDGFTGLIGEGGLTEATGVAAYTYKVEGEQADRYVFVADAATDQVKIFSGADIRRLKPRKTIGAVDEDKDPETPDQELGFGEAGAYLAVDPGNGNPATGKCEVEEQACTAGHFLVYDAANEVIDEFEAAGEFLDQIPSPEPPAPAFADAKPTATAIDRAGGANDGTIYVSAGDEPGARVPAFEPLAPTRRPKLPKPPSRVLNESPRTVSTDSLGNVYVAVGSRVRVYHPSGTEIKVGPGGTGIQAPGAVSDLAIDSTGNLYVRHLDDVNEDDVDGPEDYFVQYCALGPYPPQDGTQCGAWVLVAEWSDFLDPTRIVEIALDPADDRLFVGGDNGEVLELGSAAEGSAIEDPCFGCGGRDLGLNDAKGIGIHGASGNFYIALQNKGIYVIDRGEEGVPDDEEVIARITGAGGKRGRFFGSPGKIAVDQSNGHVLVFNSSREVAEEYDASGGFVAEFGDFTPLGRHGGIAIDNSGGAGEGNVYVTFDDTAPGTPDLWAFGPLTYGASPEAVTGPATGVGGGEARLNGAVDPRGFLVEDCHFEYLTEAEFQSSGFAGATPAPCAETPAEIGRGDGPVPVHAEIAGLDPEGRYRYRLVAKNKYGEDQGEPPGRFGPPEISPEEAAPAYTEATLRATIDPWGLETKYRFEYGESEAYGQATAEQTLKADSGPTKVEVPIFELKEGTAYHFRLIAENEAKAPLGADQTFKTLVRLPIPPCPNAEYRTGLSANLPDCRAYELVTPADTRGAAPYQTPAQDGVQFDNWLVDPRGERAGESVAFFIDGTLPDFEGNGRRDAYRALRRQDEGPHPKAGWQSELFSPSYLEAGGSAPGQHGVAADQEHSFWEINPPKVLAGTLEGSYLRTPAGFEEVGEGSLAPFVDPDANAYFVSEGGTHVIFSSQQRLEPAAPPAGTTAIYDRTPAGTEVVSVKPDGSSFGAGEHATYVGSTEDGSAVVFEVGGALYLRRGNSQTVKVAADPNTFAGIAEDGSRLFYAEANIPDLFLIPAELFAFEVDSGTATPIAEDSIFVHVSADGSHVYFISEEVLDDAEEGTEGADNLYLWDGTGTRFIAVLDPQDLISFGGSDAFLGHWTGAIGPKGRAYSPTRATPDGSVLVFESHARLTSYDNTEPTAAACGEAKVEGDRCAEIYRYDTEAAPGERLACVSCDPAGSRPGGDATLQTFGLSGISQHTLIPNLTDDGKAVFFQTNDPLLPNDANGVIDVYAWKAPGVGAAGSCDLPGGCLALISSGQGETDNFLYGMTPDGHDVFFTTPEKLHGVDVTGSPSIYDARVEGGIPDPPPEEDCQGDACQGQGTPPPPLPAPTSTGSGDGNLEAPKAPCGRPARQAKRLGVQAERLRHAARRSQDPKRAQAMRRRAHRLAARADRLNRQARHCRRAKKGRSQR